jgi:hypothetical protein
MKSRLAHQERGSGADRGSVRPARPHVDTPSRFRQISSDTRREQLPTGKKKKNSRTRGTARRAPVAARASLSSPHALTTTALHNPE